MSDHIYQLISKYGTEELIAFGQRNAVKLFHSTADLVPAYRDFLRRHSVQPDKIHTYQDLLAVPPIHKQNYLRYYDPPQLVPEGKIYRQEIISLSSGSSGTPFYWPRQQKEDQRATEFFGLMLPHAFRIKAEPVLCIIGFAMGSWIAGPHCLEGMRGLNRAGTNVTCITPGNNKDEIITILQTLSPYFERTILLAYPPFAKDVIDHALDKGLNLATIDLSFIFAGENFSEEWRDYIGQHSSIPDPRNRMFTIYGTADAGIIAHETPYTISTRRKTVSNRELFSLIYQDDSFIPSLVSYFPPSRDITTEGDQLILTVDSGIPLVRYQIGDRGEVLLPYQIEEVTDQLSRTLDQDHRWSAKLPMLTLRGRTDLAAIFYSANIYPENIKRGTESKNLSQLITGKFIVRVHVSETDMTPTLIIRVQLKPRIEQTPQLSELIKREVVHALRTSNSEYEDVLKTVGEQAEPIIELAEHDSQEFKPDTKHRWLAKG